MNCKYKHTCWMYNGISCLFKSDCDVIEHLQALRDNLYQETLIDAQMQLEQGDLANTQRIMNEYKRVQLTSPLEWENFS